MFSTQSCASFLKATIYSSRQSGGSGQVWRKTRLRRLMKCYWKHCPFDRPFAPAMPLCTNSNIAQRVNAQLQKLSSSREDRPSSSPFCQSVVSLSSLSPVSLFRFDYIVLKQRYQERENGFLEHVERSGLKFHLTWLWGINVARVKLVVAMTI